MSVGVAAVRLRATNPDLFEGRRPPQVPFGDLVAESGRWWTWYPLGRESRPGVFCHVRLMCIVFSPGEWGIWIVAGNPAVIAEIRDRAPRWWGSVRALREDLSAADVRTAWPDERPRELDGTPIGERLRLYASIAGWDFDVEAET